MSFICTVYTLFFGWKFLSYFCVLILIWWFLHTFWDICEVSGWFHHSFEISVKYQNDSIIVLCYLLVPTGQFFVVRMLHEASRLIHLSPQFIKKKLGNFSILPRKWHHPDSNPYLPIRRSMLCRWAIEPLTKWWLLPDFIYVIYAF